MPTLSNLPLENSLVSKTLNQRNPFNRVYDLSGGYNTLTQLVNMLNVKNGSKEVDTEIYEKSKIGNMGVATLVGANALVGTNLVITLSNPTYDLFRTDEVVMDSERNKGHVIAHSPGSVTIMPDGGGTFNAATMFTAGMTIKRGWGNSANRNSAGRSSIYNTPDMDYNYSMVMRESNYLAHADMIDTYVKTYKGNWYTAQELEMVNRFAMQTEYRNLFSMRGQTLLPTGLANQNGGLEWAIKNRGGNYVPSSSAITESQWIDLIRQTTIKKATNSNRLLFLHGKQALYDIQNFTKSYLVTAGTNNTFGGKSVSGLDIQTWAIAGTQVDFLHLPILDDPLVFPEISSITGKPRYSSMFFLLDLSPIPAAYDNGGAMPCIEKFHFGQKEMYHGYIPGIIGDDGGSPTSYMQGNKNLMANDIAGVSSHLYSWSGIDVIDAKNMTMFELAS